MFLLLLPIDVVRAKITLNLSLSLSIFCVLQVYSNINRTVALRIGYRFQITFDVCKLRLQQKHHKINFIGLKYKIYATRKLIFHMARFPLFFQADYIE